MIQHQRSFITNSILLLNAPRPNFFHSALAGIYPLTVCQLKGFPPAPLRAWGLSDAGDVKYGWPKREMFLGILPNQ